MHSQSFCFLAFPKLMFSMLSPFQDSPEYIRRIETPFQPTKVSLAEIHSAVPSHLHEKSTLKTLGYVFRDVLSAVALYKLAWMIEPSVQVLLESYGISSTTSGFVKWLLWGLYWYAQGIVLAGWWCLAHEAGHGALSDYTWINHTIGWSLHTALLCPYWAWRSSHRTHHKASASIERDEIYVPQTRSDFNLPPASKARLSDYHEVFDDTPLYHLVGLIVMQLSGFQQYLLINAMSSPRYPPGTNHFQPSSALFKVHERQTIIAGNIALVAMASLLAIWTKTVGFSYFVKLYFLPYLLSNHWVVMLTYIQHSDPTIPHYREKEWTFVRGALSTVDRPLLGYLGRFYLHNSSHDHVAHHLFSSIPFYNQPKVTEAIKKVLKEDYCYDTTNTFRVLYRSFTQCLFVEDEGDILFYKNRDGKAGRVVASNALGDAPKKKIC